MTIDHEVRSTRVFRSATDATDGAKAIATLNYWGEILRTEFRKSNH